MMITPDRIGFALGHPVRAAMVSELLSGRFVPSGELAKIGRERRITPAGARELNDRLGIAEVHA
jgi:hypothetical protein